MTTNQKEISKPTSELRQHNTKEVYVARKVAFKLFEVKLFISIGNIRRLFKIELRNSKWLGAVLRCGSFIKASSCYTSARKTFKVSCEQTVSVWALRKGMLA